MSLSSLFSSLSSSSPLSSCGVVWCGVCVGVCVCWRAAHSPQFPSKLLELNSFVRYSD